eukprot:356460-Chlamydomonas_euryale.AAC.9
MASGHRYGQKARRLSLPDSLEVCDGGVPQLMHTLNAAQLTRLGHVARVPDESVGKQLLFSERRVGLGGMVGRPRPTWRNRALAALRLAITSRLARGGGGYVAQDHAQWHSFCDSTQPYPTA